MTGAAGLQVRPLGPRFGAEVIGLGAADRLHRRALDDLRGLLLRHRVLGLRDQHLDDAGHARLAERLAATGPATGLGSGARRPAPGPGGDACGNAGGLAHLPSPARWVSGGSYRLAPPAVVAIRAVQDDVEGEATRFADAVGAYRDLPEPLRALADRSWSVHTRGPGEPESAVSAVHPVTRLHPETGERALLLGGHARRVTGLDPAASRTVLALLQSYLVRPHNVTRWSWRPGDLVLVDARAVQWHARPGTAPRTATTAWSELDAQAPLGVDGRHSHAVGAGLPAHRLSA